MLSRWGRGDDDFGCGGRYGANGAARFGSGVVGAVSDPGMALLVFAVTAVALPLAFLAGWSLFKNLIS